MQHHPGVIRHPYARQLYQPWEVAPDMEVNNNQARPPYPPFNQGAAPAHSGSPSPRYQWLVYAHCLQQTLPYYPQGPVCMEPLKCLSLPEVVMLTPCGQWTVTVNLYCWP